MTSSALYGLIDNHVSTIIKVFDDNIGACLLARSFKDAAPLSYMRPRVLNIVTGLQIFMPIAVLFAE